MKRSWINEAEIFSKNFFAHDTSGHDWEHTNRVRNQAVEIARIEGADTELCEIGALLHDVIDEKFHSSKSEGELVVQAWMTKQAIPEKLQTNIISMISSVAFQGGNNQSPPSLEGAVIQDADRLDAIGAVGIARCFMYAGNKGTPMYTPGQAVRESMSEGDYRDRSAAAITHFYEKLLLLKDLMNTETGKKRAEVRHERLLTYLDDFYSEWEGTT
ncbi:HD domain-containing protein [Alkalicoccus halolimnae]|uniref:HD domain-containing protein n=1 Tax=Alkalicoccus halolimnae TaxID=1667239 RepID=A0A5C7F984_9BACI|nr:HD domain-containing protein [Alkalicoccus halolimnae]TXF87271.1 HD domain-containing protein [Alkalicoccus halolimnae]